MTSNFVGGFYLAQAVNKEFLSLTCKLFSLARWLAGLMCLRLASNGGFIAMFSCERKHLLSEDSVFVHSCK